MGISSQPYVYIESYVRISPAFFIFVDRACWTSQGNGNI